MYIDKYAICASIAATNYLVQLAATGTGHRVTPALPLRRKGTVLCLLARGTVGRVRILLFALDNRYQGCIMIMIVTKATMTKANSDSWVEPMDAAIATGLTLNYIYILLRSERIEGAWREGKRWRVPVAWVTAKAEEQR